jgi:hypothetical protein
LFRCELIGQHASVLQWTSKHIISRLVVAGALWTLGSLLASPFFCSTLVPICMDRKNVARRLRLVEPHGSGWECDKKKKTKKKEVVHTWPPSQADGRD